MKIKILLRVPHPSQWLSLRKQMTSAVKNVREEERVFSTLLLGSKLVQPPWKREKEGGKDSPYDPAIPSPEYTAKASRSVYHSVT